MASTKTAERPLSFQDLPDWGKVAAYVGPLGVIALYLVYLLGTTITAKQDAHAQEARDATTRQVQLLQRICVNTATTDAARGECLR